MSVEAETQVPFPGGTPASAADSSAAGIAREHLACASWNGAEEPPAQALVHGVTVQPAWQHPLANRQIVLDGGHALGYLLQRRRRRTVGMKVAFQGLEVNAPVWAGTAEIERILQQKSGWIVGKLQDLARLQHERHLARPLWQDGQYVPWRGGLLRLRLCQPPQADAAAAKFSSGRMQKLAAAARLLPVSADVANNGVQVTQELQLDLPVNSRKDVLRDCTANWMQQQALALFTARMTHYAALLGVRHQTLKLSQAGTRWGSASGKGVIRLHWRLVQMPDDVLDYVVVHELAHLREMNHGPRFWALVESILPDYRQRQFRLKHTTLAPW